MYQICLSNLVAYTLVPEKKKQKKNKILACQYVQCSLQTIHHQELPVMRFLLFFKGQNIKLFICTIYMKFDISLTVFHATCTNPGEDIGSRGGEFFKTAHL